MIKDFLNMSFGVMIGVVFTMLIISEFKSNDPLKENAKTVCSECCTIAKKLILKVGERVPEMDKKELEFWDKALDEIRFDMEQLGRPTTTI